MDERSEQVRRRLDIPMLIAALLVIPALILEESDVPHDLQAAATVLNWAIWGAFVAELAIMLRVVPDRRRWLREHPLDVALVLLTPPFLPASMQSARVFRLLRVVRLVRMVQLSRRIFSLAGLRDAAVLALVTVLAGGTAFAAVEKGHHGAHDPSAWDGLWWAMTTVTTVGYGDITAKTTEGRAIGIAVMLVGIGFIAILTAAAAQRFIVPGSSGLEPPPDEPAAIDVIAEVREMSLRLQRLEEHLLRGGAARGEA